MLIKTIQEVVADAEKQAALLEMKIDKLKASEVVEQFKVTELIDQAKLEAEALKLELPRIRGAADADVQMKCNRLREKIRSSTR